MTAKKRHDARVSATIPSPVKKRITALVKSGRYESTADFLRDAVYRLLDAKNDENKDILSEKKFQNFIEKIS
ncbi:hypothetical protein BMS3Abin16_00875 [archaeon BMS3Abin16]|nr:hypothetical protein BMS3Abin16_00875 [archaeon BMS3Abin16]GBE56557.1 hypothetical protein BMS3Bbin16_00766 [archaeon BMS3Bbin16]HDY74880.1 hypothetical protein [Euryarchaeota archaeon]